MNKIKSEWCLFLDRDGVINKRMPGDYVKTWDEFIFLPQVLITLKKLKPFFKYIFIVTNQQGVGKGLMTLSELHSIHKSLKKVVRKNGGHIDEIFYCPDLSNTNSTCRKPEIGMGLQAKKKYPSVDFGKSILVGDSSSDIAFGKNLKMITIFIETIHEQKSPRADYSVRNLHEFYLTFVSKISKNIL